MIEGGVAWWSEAFAHVYVGLWGAGTVLTVISFERGLRRRRLFFRLGISCLALGAGMGLVTDWDNTLRVTMSITALVLCGIGVTISALKDRIRRKRKVRLLKEAIQHMGQDNETDEG